MYLPVENDIALTYIPSINTEHVLFNADMKFMRCVAFLSMSYQQKYYVANNLCVKFEEL